MHDSQVMGTANTVSKGGIVILALCCKQFKV